jgi:hypothetical protein
MPDLPEDESREPIARERRRIIMPSAIATLGTPAHEGKFALLEKLGPDCILMMGDNPALPKMPAKPTLADFFRSRLHTPAVRHLLQSARHARDAGAEEKIVLACLLHDIALGALMSTDHGYWGAQLIEPYVDPEVSWAVRHHQALRYFPDPAVNYEYPDAYVTYFGEDYVPPPYIEQAYREARQHRWYMSARMITVWDVYSFDGDTSGDIAEFEDIIGRHFRQPPEGLGFDDSPVAHMWRTMIWPHNFL